MQALFAFIMVCERCANANEYLKGMHYLPQRDIETGGSNGYPDALEKIKRTRRPWVYKSEYDHLRHKYIGAKWLALVGWILFAIALKVILQ